MSDSLSLSQAERRQRGENFQDEIRESWRMIPNCWRYGFPQKGDGTAPADSIIMLKDVNILAELKRVHGNYFDFGCLRKNQVKALRDFEKVLRQNISLIFVSFLREEEGIDECYAVPFHVLVRLLVEKDSNRVTRDELKEWSEKTLGIKQLLRNADGLWDLKGINAWLR